MKMATHHKPQAIKADVRFWLVHVYVAGAYRWSVDGGFSENAANCYARLFNGCPNQPGEVAVVREHRQVSVPKFLDDAK